MAKYQSTKTYGTDRGLSCVFRQWKANHSHCSTLHGYSLGFKFVWESDELDEKNWVFDFGGMKPIKNWLDHMFDHTMLVAEDDPALEAFKTLARFSTQAEFNGLETTKEVGLHEEGRVTNIRIVPGVGCEMTAKLVYDKSSEILEDMKVNGLGRYPVHPSVRLVSVECFEHSGNSAVYLGENPPENSGDRKVFFIDVSDVDAATRELEEMRKLVRARQTIDSGAIKNLKLPPAAE